MIEAISRILDAIAKYAWGVFVVCLFVVVMPENASKAMGLTSIKAIYLGYFWLGLIFSAAVWSGAIFSRISEWVSTRHHRNARRSTVIKRLETLDLGEYKWIAYCLLYNVQTVNATAVNPTANSLLGKGIVTQGSGSMLKLPYHMQDFVWEYLQSHRDDFLPREARENPKTIAALDKFAADLLEVFQ